MTGGMGGSVAEAPTPTVAITAPTVGSKVPATKPLAVTVSAMVAAPGQIARVEIVSDDAIVGMSTMPPFTVSLPMLPAGMRSLMARAVTTDNKTATSTPVSFTAVAAPTVALTAPAANALLPQSGQAQLSATAASTAASVRKVEFYDGETLLGSASATPYNLGNVTLQKGIRSLTAVAEDDLGQRTTSAPVAVTVAWTTGAHLEQDGQVTFEAEAYTSKNDNGDIGWQVQSTEMGFVGTGYVVVPSASFSIKAQNDASEASSELSYAIEFTKPGSYFVYARVLLTNNDRDSFYFRLNEGAFQAVLSPGHNSSFIWRNLGMVMVTNAGANTFTLKRREANAIFDRLMLSTSMQLPSGDGPPASPKGM